jgi:hypothetical protein
LRLFSSKKLIVFSDCPLPDEHVSSSLVVTDRTREQQRRRRSRSADNTDVIERTCSNEHCNSGIDSDSGKRAAASCARVGRRRDLSVSSVRARSDVAHTPRQRERATRHRARELHLLSLKGGQSIRFDSILQIVKVATEREVRFYERVVDVTPSLLPFIPKYYGVLVFRDVRSNSLFSFLTLWAEDFGFFCS